LASIFDKTQTSYQFLQGVPHSNDKYVSGYPY